MHRLIRLFSTSIGRKLVLAVTGLMLLGFLMAHMLGNMSLFQGPEVLNAYAAWLQGHPALWVMRSGLAIVFGIHVYVAIQLALENRAARPTRYAASQVFQRSWASRYMVFSGLLVISFVIYHLLHFTFGVIDADHTHAVDEQGRRDVYHMVLHGFRNPWITGSYVVAMAILAIGPVLGGYLIDSLNWRYVYLMGIPVSIIVVPAAAAFLPGREKNTEYKPLDWQGLALVTVAISSLLVAFSNGQREGWSSNYVLLWFLAAMVGTISFIAWEKHTAHPLLDLRVFGYHRFSMITALAFIFGAGLYGTTYLVPLFLQIIQHMTASDSGLMMLPAGLVMVKSSRRNTPSFTSSRSSNSEYPHCS